MKITDIGGLKNTDEYEKKSSFKPEKIEKSAKVMPDDGEYVVRDNCESVFGVKINLREEETLKKLKRKPFAAVYVSTEYIPHGVFFPEERQTEIDSVTSEKVKNEKANVWALLEIAIKNTFRRDMNEISFSKERNGKWKADKFFFSLSHTDGLCAVIVSDKPCGIDVENVDKFRKKCADKSFIRSFSKKIGCENETDETRLLQLWTRKESIFKSEDKSFFAPKKISADDKNTGTFSFGKFVLSATSESPEKIIFRKYERGNMSVMIAEEVLFR